jgi:hypothetical protein
MPDRAARLLRLPLAGTPEPPTRERITVNVGDA